MKQSDVITAAADVIAANGGQDGPVRAAPHARNPGPVERDLRWIADELGRGTWPNPPVPGLFTRDEVSQAVNDGADLVSGGVVLSNSAEDLLNLVVNAVMSKLDDPAVTLDEAIERSYDEEDPETVKGWVA